MIKSRAYSDSCFSLVGIKRVNTSSKKMRASCLMRNGEFDARIKRGCQILLTGEEAC